MEISKAEWARVRRGRYTSRHSGMHSGTAGGSRWNVKLAVVQYIEATPCLPPKPSSWPSPSARSMMGSYRLIITCSCILLQ